MLGKQEIGRRLRVARKSKGLTVQAAADAACVAISTISMYETGHRVPCDTAKVKLSEVYEVPIQDLFYLAEDATEEGTNKEESE